MMYAQNDIEQDYFHWLCELVGIENQDKSYWMLAKDLNKLAFIPLIDRDENRAMDGLDLRDQFLDCELYPESAKIEGECSVFEMIIALAQRMDFQTSGVDSNNRNKTAYWFWEMMDNLNLTVLDDESYDDYIGRERVEEIVDVFVNREYDFNGVGGLFPLRYAEEDQRKVEIWYQMSAYLYEREV